MSTRRDPLGKRALFGDPVVVAVAKDPKAGSDEPLAADPEFPRWVPPATSGGSSAGSGNPRATTITRSPSSELLAVTCSTCGARSGVGLMEFARLQFPVPVWLPRRTYDRWMTCPACRHRAWTSVTFQL